MSASRNTKTSGTLSRGPKPCIYSCLPQIDKDREKLNRLMGFLPIKSSNHVIFRKEVMEAIWKDMKRTQLPLWISPAPPNWGTMERGKLSTDQWRVICTIHLPIMLIQLWSHDVGWKREMLTYFMDLVSAVRIANMCVMSQNQIQAYNQCIQHYATCCTELFPNKTLKPNLHATLHLGDILDLFGPVHAISTPFYERYINFFYCMNINIKIGLFKLQFFWQ